MHTKHDPIAFYRHVLRSGDVQLARRLTRVLHADPEYRSQAASVLRALPAPHGGRTTPGGRMLDELLARMEIPHADE